MNKGELIALMADHSSQSKAECERALNLVTESIIKALSKGHDITLVGFGSWTVQKRKARTGRNPQTGKPIQIPEYKQVGFRPGKLVKEAGNGEQKKAKPR